MSVSIFIFFLLQVPTDVEKCQDRVECFNADLKADMERWQNNKRQDFRQLLMGMADKNIQYYEKVCGTEHWQRSQNSSSSSEGMVIILREIFALS